MNGDVYQKVGGVWTMVGSISGPAGSQGATGPQGPSGPSGGGSSTQQGIGVYASLPSSGMNAGDRYRCTDCPYEFYYNGSAWLAFYKSFPATIPPLAGSLTWVNHSSAVVGNAGGMLAISGVSMGGCNAQLLKKSAPPTPWTFTAGLELNTQTGNYVHSGLVIRDPNTSKFILFGPGTAGGVALNLDYFNNPTSFGSAAKEVAFAPDAQLFLKITDDGTNHTYFTSADGINWLQFYQASRTAFLAAPTEVGIGIDSENYALILSVFHWSGV